MKKLVLFLLFIFVFQTLGFAACSPGYYAFRGGCPDCLPGSYCPGGDSAPLIPCNAPGFFCPDRSTTTYGNPASYVAGCGSDGRGQCTCDPGYYCPLGSMTSHGNAYPGDSDCSYGATCECPLGTYRPARGADSLSDCAACDAGWWCPNPTTRNPCTAGHYCPAGYSSEQPCPAGTYQPNDNATSADACHACGDGYTCPNASTRNLCPAGYYCSGGSQIACQAGYFCPDGSTNSHGNPINANTDCPGGVCSCEAGSYCPSGSKTKNGNPLSPASGYKYYCAADSPCACPAGSACPAQSSAPTGCGDGEYQQWPGQSSCTTCPAGSYCNGSWLTAAATCDPGHYCPAGSDDQQQCDYGEYQPDGGQSSCLICPAGSYCQTRGLLAPTNLCPQGNSCPEGTRNPNQCLTGRYQPDIGQSSCLDCPAGSYCNGTGRSTVSGICDAKYYCPAGSTSNQGRPYKPEEGGNCLQNSVCSCSAGYYCPQGSTMRTGRPYTAATGECSVVDDCDCPAGSACPAQSGTPVACLAGRYQQNRGQTSCDDCPVGKYCQTTGLSAPTGDCTAGYYCPLGSQSGTGQPYRLSDGCPINSACNCTAGYYCPTGSTKTTGFPLTTLGGCTINTACACPAGTYQSSTNATSSASCTACSVGYYCPTPATTNQKICETGYYCPNVAQDHMLCPAGKYCSTTGISSSAESLPICTAGYYCPAGSRAATGQPNNSLSPCTINATCFCTGGNYCPPGSQGPQGNPLTDSIVANDNSNSFTCLAGQPCLCPIGNKCPTTAVGIIKPTACDVGTYQDQQGQTGCKTCDPGYVCKDKELGSQIRCPSNTTSPQGNTELRNCYIVTNNGISFMDSNSSVGGLQLNQILGNVTAVTNVSEANRCYYNPI